MKRIVLSGYVPAQLGSFLKPFVKHLTPREQMVYSIRLHGWGICRMESSMCSTLAGEGRKWIRAYSRFRSEIECAAAAGMKGILRDYRKHSKDN